MDRDLLERVQQLSAADRLELVEELWESLVPDELPVSDADRQLIDDRLRDLREYPADERPWSEAKADLHSRLT